MNDEITKRQAVIMALETMLKADFSKNVVSISITHDASEDNCIACVSISVKPESDDQIILRLDGTWIILDCLGNEISIKE